MKDHWGYDNERKPDIVEVVRCKDCKYYVPHFKGCERNPSIEEWRENDFCNYGERRNE